MTESSGADPVNKRITLLIISLMIGAAALAGALLCEKTSDDKKVRTTLEWTDEQIMTLPYFEIVASGDENRNMPCDIKGYSIGDGFIHLVLPDTVPEKEVVVYVRDAEGNDLARHVYDFTQKVMIGPWEIVLDHHTLPSLYFESDTPGVYDAMIASDAKDIICGGNMRICMKGERVPQGEGSVVHASLQGRGHSSWNNVTYKKSYSLRLDKAVSLLGLGKNRNWNLVGNGFDHSLIKNCAFNEISRKIGIEYQPQMHNINLYVDGVYQGVYTLTTKISVDKDRIALRPGDYMYRLDPPVPEAPLLYTSTAWFKDNEPYYPVADLVYPELPDADLETASALLQSFITLRDDPAIPGLENMCDLRSLAKYYWIQEIAMNFDACSCSVYFYYNGSDHKIHFGPVWDMDLTIGVTEDKQDVDFSEPTGWKIRQIGWYKALFARPEFVEAVNDVYYNGGVRSAMLSGTGRFEELRNTIGSDGDLDFLLFGHVAHTSLDYPYGDTYEEYCDNVIAFYRTRADWIDGQMSR